MLLLLLASLASGLLHHRQGQSAIIIKSVLYIDGGEVVNWSGQGTGFSSNGSSEVQFSVSPENNTYSINLNGTWSNSTVLLNTIEKAAPVQTTAALWANAREDSFFAYDGGNAGGVKAEAAPNELWWFSPLGLGGTWSRYFAGNMSGLQRLTDATYASGGGLGFALGGLANPSTGNSTGSQAVAGMVVYNQTDDTWQNVSAGYDYAAGSSAGAGHFVSCFGPQGLFFAFGGLTGQQTPITFANAFMYEPQSQTWAIQAVTGDKPPPSANPCVVGAVNRGEGTYEIFLYGGLQKANGQFTSDGSIYILTLPAFHWTKISATAPGRYKHSCASNILGQMISVGGIVIPGSLSNEADATNGAPDPWHNTLGVFDMITLQWKYSYDSSHGSYVTPSIVKDYYRSNGRYPAWTMNATAKWFTTDSKLGNNSVNYDDENSSKRDHSWDGVLAILIVGPIIGLIIIISISWCSVKYFRRTRGQPAYGHAEQTPPTIPAAVVKHATVDQREMTETQGNKT